MSIEHTRKAIDEKEAIAYMIEEIEEMMSPNDKQRDIFESIKSQFHESFAISQSQKNVIMRIYERITT